LVARASGEARADEREHRDQPAGTCATSGL
jgi:hypothetical protein